MVDEAGGLELIPRTVRDKLDRVGIKLHLKEWQQLALDERALLRDLACDSAEEVASYRRQLETLVHRRTGRMPEHLTSKQRA